MDLLKQIEAHILEANSSAALALIREHRAKAEKEIEAQVYLTSLSDSQAYQIEIMQQMIEQLVSVIDTMAGKSEDLKAQWESIKEGYRL